MTITGEVRHGSGPTDLPILPPKPDLPLPCLPPKPTQTTSSAAPTVQEAPTLMEKHEEQSDHTLPLPLKPSENYNTDQEFDVSLFTDFDESLPIPDLPAPSDLNTEELTDFSLLSPPPESLLELPFLPESLDLPPLGITSDEVDKPAISPPEGMDQKSYLRVDVIMENVHPWLQKVYTYILFNVFFYLLE